MKKFMKTIFRTVIVYTVAIIRWSAFKAVFNRMDMSANKDDFSYSFHFKARWYSPTFWTYSLLRLPLFLLSGGLLDWIEDIITDINGYTYEEITQRGEFKKGVSIFNKRISLFGVIYSRLI